MPTPLTELDEILASLRVNVRGDFIYAAVDVVPDDADVLAAIWEREGLGVIVESSAAEALGNGNEPVFTCLTLEVYSSLESVGLTAAVSARLAERGISCNVVAGLHHDHLLVPKARADEAELLLNSLAR